MSHAKTMLDTHPAPASASTAVADALHALDECATTCRLCADACLGEEMVAELRRCITLDLDCADICAATSAVLGRQTQPETTVVRAALEACITVCDACAAECDDHAGMHDHCRICADACRRCADACRAALGELR